ncbi:MAG TPA: P1 family peptidase [Hyphomicrobiaceae bacterium]|nr:P1 family peptidase [Hyphomicrobiaceae bacterium]
MVDRFNLVTDVQGIAVGNAEDAGVATGVTAIMLRQPNVVSGVIRGGAPGTRDTTILNLDSSVQGADAIVLSGGSAFGLDAAGGVMAVLRDRGIGFQIRDAVVPIVIQAIVFDLLNGGDKSWGRESPYIRLGMQAADVASPGRFGLGNVGGGFGATTATLKGGLGSASAITSGGHTVGAIAIVNAVGSATIGNGPHFWAWPVERDGEFGGFGAPPQVEAEDLTMRIKGGDPVPPSTTIALVATDAILTKAQAARLAHMADDGLARAIRPAHAPMDGDTVIAAAMQAIPLRPGREAIDLTELGLVAGDCLARAIARGVYEASALPFPAAPPSWRDRFGHLSPPSIRRRS